MDGRALFAGGMGGVRGVGQAGPGLARVVIKLHQAEDQVCGHQLKLVRRIGDDIPAGGTWRRDGSGWFFFFPHTMFDTFSMMSLCMFGNAPVITEVTGQSVLLPRSIRHLYVGLWYCVGCLCLRCEPVV